MTQKQLNVINSHIGKRIKELRRQQNLNQAELAKAMRLTRTSICNIESGRQGLSPLNIFMVCSILKCTPNDIFPEMKQVEIKFETVVEKKWVEKEKYIPNIIFK